MYGNSLTEDQLESLKSHVIYKIPNSEAERIYFQYILPRFIKFSASNGFNIENWDKQNSKQPFEQLLKQTLDSWTNFEGLAPYIAVEQVLYFIYCTPKGIGGIPHDKDSRQDYLDKHKLFSISVYSVGIQSIIEQNILLKQESESNSSKPDLSFLFLIFGIILGVIICFQSM